jgi:nicotinamidase-related amidase
VIKTDAQGKPVGAGLYPQVRPFLIKEGLRQNTWGAGFLNELPAPDVNIEKIRPSGFYCTSLEVVLRGLGVEVLVLSGVFTNQCVESTARDAWARDFRFIVLEDCTGTFDDELQRATLKNLSLIGYIMTSDEFIQFFEQRDPLRDKPEKGCLFRSKRAGRNLNE